MKGTHDNNRPPRKIAVVIPKYGLLGGAERFAAEMTERLARNPSYEFHVFANRWQAAPDSPVVFRKIPNLPFPRSVRPWAFAWLVQRATTAQRFDLVHSHDRIFHANIVSLHCIPHRFWVREIRKKKASLFDLRTMAVEQRMIRSGRNTTFLPVSSIAHEIFQREYCTLPGQWQTMHPGVDFKRFSSPDRGACRAEIHARHGLRGCDFLVLFVGMNFELKGLDTVMESVGIARRQKPHANIGLLVIGRGNEEKYRAKARALDISETVSFAGPISTNIERYYRAADTLMMLSGFDTFGMVVLEAMAAGMPVIVSPTVGARDIVDEGRNGYILSDQPTAEVAAGALIKATDEGRFPVYARQASETARRHSWRECADQMRNIYTAHLDGARKPK